MFIKNKNILYSVFFTILFVSLFGLFSYASAATLGLNPSSGSYSTGDTIRVKISVSSSFSINAVSGTIKYSNDILNLTSISKAGSIINLWAQEPTYSNSSGTANFEGVILSGYSGSGGTVLTLVFKAKGVGVANLSFSGASVLANDGNGTEVLSGKGTSSLSIVKAKQIEQAPATPTKGATRSTVIKIEEINNNKDSQRKFLVTPPEAVKDNTYSVAIDFMDVISWVDDGTHVFQSPELVRGTHSIKITATAKTGLGLSGFIEFSTTTVSAPLFTDYPTNMYVDEFLVLKGTADPLADVVVTVTNMETNESFVGHSQTNSSNKFTFVSDSKMAKGTYSIVAKAITKDGLESGPSNTLQVDVKQNIFDSLIGKISKYMTMMIPIIGLGILLLFILVYGLYHLKRFNIFLKKKLTNAEDTVSKSFKILEEDVSEEAAIFRKIKANKPLTEDERTFLTQFKKDIEEAERLIFRQVKDIERNK